MIDANVEKVELLKRLAGETLPLTIVEGGTIVLVRALSASDLVAAVFGTQTDLTPFARVLAITKDGHSVLALDRAVDARGELTRSARSILTHP